MLEQLVHIHRCSFADNIGAAFASHPDLMAAACSDIDAGTGAKGLLLWILVVGIRDSQSATRDQMGRYARM